VFRKGMLRCGLCGAPMVPSTSHGVGKHICMTRHRDKLAGCPMPMVDGKTIDAAVFDHFTTVGLSYEDTCAEVAAAHDRELAEVRALRAASERAEMQAASAKQKIDRDYKYGDLAADKWNVLSAEVETEHETAAAETMRLRSREAELAERDALAEAEQHVLEHLAAIRESIAGDVSAQTTLDGLRATLLALFEEFTLHSVALCGDGDKLPPLVYDALNPPGYIIEPHVRVPAIAERSATGRGVELHRVPLALARKESASSQSA
jgi:hypothetical protein